MKKYLYIEIRVQCGEYQFEIPRVAEVGVNVNTNTYLTNQVKTFYEGEYEREENDFYFYGGEIAVRIYAWKEITKEQFESFNSIRDGLNYQ